MRLCRFTVENHSRLQDASIDVRQHLILVGPNDVGKSSVLRCLDFLLGASTAQLYNRVTVDDFADPAAPLVFEAQLTDLSADEKALFPDEADVDATTGVVSLTIRLTVTTDASGGLQIDRGSPRSGTGRQLSRNQIDGLGWTLLGATALARDVREDRRGTLNDILKRVDLGTEQTLFETLVAQVQQALQDSLVLAGLRDDLAGQLTRALPVAVSKDQLALVTPMADGDILADLRLRVERHGETKDITEQSDGLRALFALAMYDLVSVGANIVGVDEPEVHLHPTSQRSLARLLQAGPNQKVLATHSSDIVSAFSPDSIVSVRPQGQLVQPSNGFLTADEKLIVHWWVRDKLEPLTAERVLAVEGISDRIVVQRCADLTDRNLDRLGISVVETDGAGDMGTIVKLFGSNGFRVPLTLLIDEDARDATAQKMAVPPADLEKHDTFISNPELESEYVSALGADTLWAALQASGLFSSNQLANCAKNGTGGNPSEMDLVAFIKSKSKYKVCAAMTVAKILDEPTARLIKSVDDALSAIAST